MHTSVLTFLTRRGCPMARLCLASALLASCTSSKTAKHLAGTTISELTAYEKSVEDKINAEKGFYRAQSALLGELQGYSVLPKASTAPANTSKPQSAATTVTKLMALERGDQESPTPATDPDQAVTARLRKSLPYLHISMASERDVVVAIDKVLGQGTPAARSALMSYVSDGVTNDNAQVEKAVLSRQLLDASVMANLAKLDSGKSNLNAAREALTQTIQKKSFFARMKDALSFGKEARSLYEAKQAPKT